MKHFCKKELSILVLLSLMSFAVVNPCMPSDNNNTVTTITGKKAKLKPFRMKWNDSENSKLNLSYLLEKPAGKNGFITIKDGCNSLCE